jgi:hypothetical protein
MSRVKRYQFDIVFKTLSTFNKFLVYFCRLLKSNILTLPKYMMIESYFIGHTEPKLNILKTHRYEKQ